MALKQVGFPPSTIFEAMQFKANAKINLGLFISSKRSDGYHNIESLFLPIPWYDEIQFKRSDSFSFSASGIEIPEDPKGNLICRAYELLRADFDLPPIQIQLRKHIPIGAGLGGGSSDGAMMLKALNTDFDLGLSETALCDYAFQLGSDCPFFIANQAAIARGRGEALELVQVPQLPEKLLLVVPPLHIATQKAYSLVQPKSPVRPIAEILRMPFEQWSAHLINDFEHALVAEYPILAKIKEKLQASGSEFVSMSGSGSAFYAFYSGREIIPDFPKDFQTKVIDLT